MIQTNAGRPTRPSRKRCNRQQHSVRRAEGATSWIFCIINYLWVATSCYLHWTDGNAVQSSNAMQGPSGIEGWRVQGEAKACVNLLNIVRKRHLQLWTWRRVKRASWEQLWGDKRKKCSSRLQCTQTRLCASRAHCDYIMYKSKLYHKPRGIFSWPGLSLALNHKNCLHHHLH